MAAISNAALEDGDPGVIVAALGDIARAKGMNGRSLAGVRAGTREPLQGASLRPSTRSLPTISGYSGPSAYQFTFSGQ